MTINENLAPTIIAMEKAALKEWNKGNPTGYLNIYADDITYLDPIQRIIGFEKINDVYENIRGKIQVEKYEMVEPVVQILSETAVLSYILETYPGGQISRWNCTEVYQEQPDKQWKITHSHWSLVSNE
jgi:ketosteroid isomerase-like protein